MSVSKLALAREHLSAFGWDGLSLALVVIEATQQLYLVAAERIIGFYPISTAKNGLGCVENSCQTPIGCHRIAQKIGADAEIGLIFQARVATDRNYLNEPGNPGDLITSRILRLTGLEDGLNRGPGIDSFDRMIYIHGTNHEELIGQKASHGCIRMNNADIIELFDLVVDGETGTYIFIMA
jgi:lipoprotein-anchoring transpeptidase ErfK/SrfK